MSRHKDAPTWIKHPRWGWLVDECPVFESGQGELWVITGRYLREVLVGWLMERGAIDVCGFVPAKDHSGANAPFWDGWDLAGTPGSYFQPLTTAARDLLAALKAEPRS